MESLFNKELIIRGPVKVIVAPNTNNNTTCKLSCQGNDIITAAVCNNHRGGIVAKYEGKQTATCSGSNMGDSCSAICMTPP